MPIITISRMYGAGGSEIAARVAVALGWQLLDNAFVFEVANRLGIPPAEVEAREERVPSLAQRFAAALALSSPEILPGPTAPTLPPDEERLVDATRHIMDEAVRRGPAVLVGHGAQAVLATRRDALHVFCYARMPALVARAAARLGVPEREAERIVAETNRQRELYAQKYYKRSWAAPANYHLCIDTGWLGVEASAELVVRLAKERLLA